MTLSSCAVLAGWAQYGQYVLRQMLRRMCCDSICCDTVTMCCDTTGSRGPAEHPLLQNSAYINLTFCKLHSGEMAAPLPSPLSLPTWLATNSHLLRPPVNNAVLYHHSGTTVMIVGGPNARSDYHINPTPEWFFQYRGGMVLKVVEQHPDPQDPKAPCRDVFRDITIHEGEMFLLPPNTPHNPIRFCDTVGLVIEQDRPTGMNDRLRWYCPNESCRKVVHEASFYCTDLGSQVKGAVVDYTSRPREERLCRECGVGVAGEKPVVKDVNLDRGGSE